MGRMASRASMQDVADALNVHVSTVSLALRDDPRINSATRQRVQAAAARLGYRTNPLVNAWLRQVRKPGVAQAGVGIAFLLGTEVSPDVRNNPYYRILLDGARAEAADLGYLVTEIRFGQDEEQRLLKAISQLRYRGVRGVMIFDPEEKIPEAVVRDLESDFAVVILLRAGGGNRFHFVGTNIGQSTMVVLARLREMGCRRIALPVHRSQVFRLRKFVLLNYLGEQQSWPEKERVPLPDEVIEHDPKIFLKWVRKVKPDALVSVNSSLHGVLRDAGYRMPGDFVFAHIGTDGRPELTGVNNRAFEIGRAAVFQLAGLITDNRFGVPEIPLMTLVPGVWSEGAAPAPEVTPAPRRRARKASKR